MTDIASNLPFTSFSEGYTFSNREDVAAILATGSTPTHFHTATASRTLPSPHLISRRFSLVLTFSFRRFKITLQISTIQMFKIHTSLLLIEFEELLFDWARVNIDMMAVFTIQIVMVNSELMRNFCLGNSIIGRSPRSPILFLSGEAQMGQSDT
jgi:hypothetical protein